MTTINKLSAVDNIQGGDQLAIYDESNGDARRSSVSLLAEFINSSGSSASSQYDTQVASPTSSGFIVAINDNSNNTHLILTPSAPMSLGTVVLPSVTNIIDKQQVLVNCTKQVSIFSVDGNGANVAGAPTALGADDFFTLKFNQLDFTWYRVG